MDEKEPADATAMVPGLVRRYAFLAVVLGLALVLVGFLRGVKEPPAIGRTGAQPGETKSDAPPAVRYSQLPEGSLRRGERPSILGELQYSTPGVFDKVTRTDEMKLQALADRARNRAFDGAPPTVPHGIDQMTTASCLQCHATGVKVGDRVATKVSHPHFSNCTQCHVEGSRPEFLRSSDFAVETSFRGAYRSGPGTRAAPGAPPTIPHATWFREDCMSCHGLLTRPGIRTTHPWLTNCTQCHAPSASRDQVAFPEVNP